MRESSYRISSFGRAVVLAGILLLLSAVSGLAQQDREQIDVPILRQRSYHVPDDLTLRVRLERITPRESTPIQWRHGGEGQGGEVVRGIFPKVGVPEASPPERHALGLGEWSVPVPVVSLKKKLPEKFFLTITAGRAGKIVDRATGRREGHSTDVAFEIEFRAGEDVVKRFTVEGPDGGTATIVIPAYQLVDGVEPGSPKFTNELTGVLGYAQRRAEFLESLSWADGPLPEKYAIINNVGGYGPPGAGDEKALRKLKQRGCYLIGFGPRGSPALSSLVPLCDAFFDAGTGGDDRLVTLPGGRRCGRSNHLINAMAGWVFTAELIGALTPRGKMPTMWKAYAYADGPQWGKRYLGKQQFHDDYQVAPQPAGRLAREYLRQIRYHLHRFQQARHGRKGGGLRRGDPQGRPRVEGSPDRLPRRDP